VLTEGNRHREVVAEIISTIPELRGSIYHDVHTVALMREHGIRVIYTRDTHLTRFPLIEMKDPLR
jgi:predicted nucleic acid-binding protein